MFAALYIVLERHVLGLDHHINGNALGRAGEFLDVLAEKAGTKPLMQFFSASPEAMSEFATSHGLAPEEHATLFPPERWFPAEDGLMTIRGLREAAKAERIDNLEQIVADLDEPEWGKGTWSGLAPGGGFLESDGLT
jgi:hypothetical protein